ncbi:MAG TPA: phage portal protein [Nocardioidaceae bacterium]|nr:phage portal protein [Nocardioidaceae bacterium]
MNLLRAARAPKSERYDGADGYHVFQGNPYWNNVLTSFDPSHEGIGTDFATLVNRAYKGNAVVAACELTRMALVSEARPKWRNLDRRQLYGTTDLGVLERPWPGGTFRQLASRMVLNADMAGTAFVARRNERPDRLMLLRPDWVVMVLGSQDDPDEAQYAMDADLLGALYYPNGPNSGRAPVPLLSDEIAVWAPQPDPLAAYRGVSWMAAAGREIDADQAASTHKLAFFENGATPQLIVSFGPEVKREHFADFVRKMDTSHAGARNAYKTLALGGGATPHVVGRDLAQLDFKVTQGAGETRIAAASGVHPVVAALSEGMAGSSLNAGNFRAACRLVADRTLRPLWGGMFAALEAIVPAPDGRSELWYDEREISFLQEDRKDAAEISFIKAQTITAYVRDGFTPESAAAAVEGEDTSLLVHSGLVSVQLQPPGQAPINVGPAQVGDQGAEAGGVVAGVAKSTVAIGAK